jgi:hypothetical protein
LQRADVKVSATPTGSNPVQILPPGGAYAQNDKVAEHVSPPLSEYVKVILKVSYNRVHTSAHARRRDRPLTDIRETTRRKNCPNEVRIITRRALPSWCHHPILNMQSSF